MSLFNLPAVVSVGRSESFLAESIYLEGGAVVSPSLYADVIVETLDHTASPALPEDNANLDLLQQY